MYDKSPPKERLSASRFAVDNDAIASLSARLPEVEWYALQGGFRVEPSAYPKGLFRAAQIMTSRFRIDAYVDEIKNDLRRLAQHRADEGREHLSRLVQQKINVLVNSFRSQHLRQRQSKPLDNLVHQVEQTDENVFDYLCGKASAKAIRRLQQRIEKNEQQLKSLNTTLTAKEAEAKLSRVGVQSDLTRVVLSLKQQIGLINQTMTNEKEQLETLLTS